MRNPLLTKISLTTVLTILTGCSSPPPPEPPQAPVVVPDYNIRDVADKFIAADTTRSKGKTIDQGLFYPKETFSFKYRYCASSKERALQDQKEFYRLVKKTCSTNKGSLINLKNTSWCVGNPDTYAEFPIFGARINTTDRWSDACSTGPFITMHLIENHDIDKYSWMNGAQLLGYQSYSNHRIIIPQNKTIAMWDQIESETPSPSQIPWTEETSFIATHIGETVCIFKKTPDDPWGVTYKGIIKDVRNERVRVLATEKRKGDSRTAPSIQTLAWHKQAIIEADARSWFICQ